MLDYTRPLLHAYQPDEVELIIPAWLQEQRFELRSLRALVESVPDSLSFTRQGEVLTFAPAGLADVPWHDEVGRLVQRYFAPQLFELLPPGAWRLNVIHATPEEIAAHYSGQQPEVRSLREVHPPAALLDQVPEHMILVADGAAMVARRHPDGLGWQYVPADNWPALSTLALAEVRLQGGAMNLSGLYRCPRELAELGRWELPPVLRADEEEADL